MSLATTVQAVQTSRPMYMTENPAAMSNFMAGFPPTHIFPGQYFNVNATAGRRGDMSPAPFFIPHGQPIDIAYSQYAPFEQKPSVPQDQRDIANALLQLNASSGSSTPQASTPTSTSMTKLNGFPADDDQPPDLLQSLNGIPIAAAISAPSFDGRPGCRQQFETRFIQDIKPVFQSISMPNITHLSDHQGDGNPIAPDISSPMSDKMFTTPPPGKQRRAGNKGNNVCQICGKSYARPSTLKTHMRTHSGEKPYRCDICGKAFTQAANLTAHLRTHSGEKPFSCPICQKRFSQSSSVTTHLRTHSGERPYRCDYCGKCFADTSTLTKHKRIHSGEKPYRCKICNLGFSQSGNLHRHMKTHNNQQLASQLNTTV